jgi:uncharacterized protein (TIGR02147 family)
MKVFQIKEYRDYIRRRIQENRAVRGYQGKLADAAGCQKSFLSQVLNSHVQLTPDHAAGLCRFWALTEDESDYFIGLVNLERAHSPHLKAALTRQLATLRQKQEDFARRFDHAQALSGGEELVYYSSWHYSAIHIALGLPGCRTPRALSERLRLPLPQVLASLAALEGLGIVRKGTGDQWTVARNDLHLAKRSALTAVHHSNWRHKAITRLHERDEWDLNYTGVHSLSARDAERIKDLLREAIADARKIVGPSPEEELVALTCDFFRL